MSKDAKSVVLLVSVALLIAGTFFLAITREHTQDGLSVESEIQATTTEISIATSSQIVYVEPQILPAYELQDWFLVHNKKYGYTYYQPDIRPLHFMIETFTEARDKDLETFVQEIWKLNQTNRNPYLENESMTQPLLVDLEGRLAYQATVTAGFDGGDRSFMVDGTYTFLFIDAPNGVKLMVYYPLDTRPNNVYAQIMKSLRVSETLIPPKESPQYWQEIKSVGYVISFPANLFKPAAIEQSEKDLLLTSVEEGVYGYMSASTKDHVFDPLNIQGMYGKIDDAVKLSIGGRDWYQYGWGDAGCGSYIYETALAQEQTLQVSFSSCPEEDAHPIIDDEPLQRQILETVTFE